MNTLVTGSGGFVGSNLSEWLRHRPGLKLLTFGTKNTDRELREMLRATDFVYHLAGVNRSASDSEFQTVNVDLTARICDYLSRLGRVIPIVFSSSVQATLDNPYGISKRQAEEVLAQYAIHTGARVVIYRLKNVFGKWSRPNYNSVVATFCHNIIHDIALLVSDPGHMLDLVYIDDIMHRFIAELGVNMGGVHYRDVVPSHRITLKHLAELLHSFHESRHNLVLPDLDDEFIYKLYGTYLSCLDIDDLAYALDKKCDRRGCLAEFIKSRSSGQVFVSRTAPGVTRGGHYHHTKAEKFLVLEGHAVVRLSHVQCSETKEYTVYGEDMRVIDIPPGFAHSIENRGSGEMITLFWASEIFDPNDPDTYNV